MDLIAQLENELKQLVGLASSTARRVELRDTAGLVLGIEFVAVDRMSSAFESLTMEVPKLVGKESSVLNTWASALSSRITYLLEHIGTVEIDTHGNQVLIRSNPPAQVNGTTQFYEVVLSAQTHGTFMLKRYRTETGRQGRDSVDILVTNETLKKLVTDLIDTIPEVD